MNDRYVISASIILGKAPSETDACISVDIGRAKLFLHGTYDAIRAFGQDVIDEANRVECRERDALLKVTA